MEAFVAAILYIMAGVFGLLMLLLYRNRPLVLYYSLFSIAIGIWTLSLSPARTLVYGGAWRPIELCSFYLMPLGLALYFDRLFEGGYRRLLTRIWQYYAALNLICLVYTVIASGSLERLLPVYQISLIAAIILWISLSIPSLHERRENLSIFIGGTIMGVTGIVDVLRALHVIDGNLQMVHFGIFAFFLSISVQFLLTVFDLGSDGATLRSIAAGTSGTGDAFFSAFVRELATAFRAHGAIIGKFVSPEMAEVETLAVWTAGKPGENFRYQTANPQIAMPAELRNLPHRFEIPLTGSNGVPVGVVSLLHERDVPRRHNTDSILEIFTARAAAEISRTQAEAAAEFLGSHDTLTGLPNRQVFMERLENEIARAKETQTTKALLLLDIDFFRKLNDSMGHQAGDYFLSKVTERLRGILQSGELVARRNGGEFMILQADPQRATAIGGIAQNICTELAKPFIWEEAQIQTSVSIGISIFPRDGLGAETLLRNANLALYHAKSSGRNQYQFFSPELNEVARERLDLERGISQALRLNQLEIYYQPQQNMRTGKIESCEALLRWQHPERGLVPPQKFIPLAEELGLMEEIGKWVLNTVAGDFSDLNDAGFTKLRISVNANAKQIQNPEFAANLEAILMNHGASPHRMEVEVTESMLLQDTQKSRQTIRRLSEMGVKFSIDDFGTGYSSLSYLRQLKIHYLKIDQSFVRDVGDDPDDAAIVRTIIGLAHNLRLSVIAEGVETVDQKDFLRAHGCDYIQGFLVARPMPKAELILFLSRFPG